VELAVIVKSLLIALVVSTADDTVPPFTVTGPVRFPRVAILPPDRLSLLQSLRPYARGDATGLNGQPPPEGARTTQRECAGALFDNLRRSSPIDNA
jgi:hypothetical protein